ncbi:M48 family metallopeptidase [Paracoccaceae bacterium]|nr:M48 family metallopeptidase [Paracoccaceae bacterium]
MNFFEQQDKARSKTARLVVMFLIGIVVLAIIAFIAVFMGYILFLGDGYNVEEEAFTFALLFMLIFVIILLLATWIKISQLRRGGGPQVAKELGGILLEEGNLDKIEKVSQHKLKVLMNINKEMALASGVPVPNLYLLEDEGVNAFAAGYTPLNSVIGVTSGAVNSLNREELQGVIAHEYSHILNGDVKINLRFAGILFGLTVIYYIGEFLLRILGRGTRRRSGKKKGGGLGAVFIIIAIACFVIGIIGRLFANIIGSLVSKQREFLADASAVQFTRNPNGIANALNKILSGFGSEVTSASSSKFSHMFFGIPAKSSGFSALFGTHPPLTDRIKRIDPTFDFSKAYVDQKTKAEPAKKVKRDNKGFIENVTGAIIATQAGNIKKASEILKKIPDELLNYASKKTEAIPLLYALIMAGSKQTKLIGSIQKRIISEKYGKDISFKGLEEKAEAIKKLDLRFRLPLLNLIIPNIKQLTEKEKSLVNFCVKGLALADGKISTFEIAVIQILKSSLNDKDDNFGLNNEDAECRSISRVVCFIASKGNMNEVNTKKAIEKGLSECKNSSIFLKHSSKFLPLNEVKPEDVLKSLEMLSNSTFKKKEVCLNAFSATIKYDKKITTEEKELQYAIFEALGCPHPKI